MGWNTIGSPLVQLAAKLFEDNWHLELFLSCLLPCLYPRPAQVDGHDQKAARPMHAAGKTSKYHVQHCMTM